MISAASFCHSGGRSGSETAPTNTHGNAAPLSVRLLSGGAPQSQRRSVKDIDSLSIGMDSLQRRREGAGCVCVCGGGGLGVGGGGGNLDRNHLLHHSTHLHQRLGE